jgi:hypothetical protein
MTKLPIPEREAEALAFARGMIATLHRSGTPWSAASPLAADGSAAFVRSVLRQAVASGSADVRMGIIALARSGDADAAAVLREAIVELKSCRQELPTELENYNMEIVRGGMGHRPPGPRKKNKLLRNLYIAVTVSAVVDRFGLPAMTRSPHQQSACSIVAEALQEAGIAMGTKAIEAISNALNGAMPTVPGWTAAWELSS